MKNKSIRITHKISLDDLAMSAGDILEMNPEIKIESLSKEDIEKNLLEILKSNGDAYLESKCHYWTLHKEKALVKSLYGEVSLPVKTWDIAYDVTQDLVESAAQFMLDEYPETSQLNFKKYLKEHLAMYGLSEIPYHCSSEVLLGKAKAFLHDLYPEFYQSNAERFIKNI